MLKLLLLFALMQAPTPLNSTPVPACSATCSYTDAAPIDGVTHTYFVEAYLNGQYSPASNSVNAIIPATGTHTVALKWQPSTTAGATYFVFRTSPPSNVKITSEN